MDLVETVQNCILRWEEGGDAECRGILIEPHANPSDPACNDILTTIYYTLLTATIRELPQKASLSVDSLTAFIKSVLDHLPSSSSPGGQSSNTAAFGELLVDLVWSADSELDEVSVEVKTAAERKAEGGAVATDKDTAGTTAAAPETPKAKLLLANLVKSLLLEGIVDPDVCRERLDTGVVANAGLIADKGVFEKKEIRTRTALFYKQNKFNLLREQSEGYSRLATELTSSLGPPHSPTTGLPVEPASVIAARARPAWDRVVGLIGHFDLDPNRALDIILDVFSANLLMHWGFLLTFLSFSSWSNSVKQPTGWSDEDTMNVEPDPEQYRGKTLDEILQMAESRGKSSTTRPSGSGKSSVLAQVLGFKFAYYQAQAGEATPRSLYLAAALLIKDGFISLEDLYAHFTTSPGEDDMENAHKKYLKSVEERISGAKISQLAMAAPLESASAPKSSRQAASTEQRRPPEAPSEGRNQKFGLVHALLSVGAIRPALAILTRHRWMVDAYPAIADLIIRVMKHSMSSLWESSQSSKASLASFSKPRARYGTSGVVPPPERRTYLTLTAPTPPSTHTTDFIYFFPPWSDSVPMCSSYTDLIDVLEPLMKFVGLHISRDPLFINKFVRLGRLHLNQSTELDTKKPEDPLDEDSPVRTFWFKTLRLYLLPALTLIRGNAVATVEIWNIIRLYDVTLRWRLYGEWRTQTYKSHPELRVRQIQADRESKGIMRRLSHNTLDSLSGTVAKLAHSNPLIFFTNAVNQIMAYDNLGGVVIQALNFVTIMGFDVLLFVVLDALANPHKDRVKDDGVNTSDWLLSLASFTGQLFRRYHSDITPLLKYIVHQLHNGQTSEIVVLRELIWKIAGIEPLPSLSDSQIVAMAGGPALRVEAVASAARGARLDHADTLLRAPQRLARGLLDSSLALPLLIQVAQQRQSCVFKTADAHIKSLASLYDTTHGVLLQYLELLTSPSIILPEDYTNKIVPPLKDLHSVYGICAPICMQIMRPILHGALLKAALRLAEKERVASEEAEKRLKAALTAKREPAASSSRVASPGEGEQQPSATDQIQEVKAPPSEPPSGEPAAMDVDTSIATVAPEQNPWLPELHALFDDIRSIAPGNAVEVLGPAFYLTFWQLSTYELSPPLSKYEEECSSLRALSRQEESLSHAADRSSDRLKRATANLHREKRNRLANFVTTLTDEMKEQTVVRSFTIKRLNREKQHWFAHNTKQSAIASAIVEHCIQPRCVLSPMDADYCAQIVKVMHSLGTPGFNSSSCYNKLLDVHIKNIIFSCSEYEARNYGKSRILTDVGKWYQSEEAYMHDNRMKGAKSTYLPGFLKRIPLSASTNISMCSLQDLLPWSELQMLVKKWHFRFGMSLITCIDTGEFMHVYNAIVVLKEVLPVFPLAAVHPVIGQRLSDAINRFVAREERGDLKILGKAYQASLKKREPLWAIPGPRLSTAPSVKPVPTGPHAAEKVRPNGTASPAPSSGDSRRATAAPSAGTPSAPRAHQQPNGTTSTPTSERSTPAPSSTKQALESVPRPELIRRVRPASGDISKASTPPPPESRGDAMDVDVPGNARSAVNGSPRPDRPSSPAGLPVLPRDVAQLKDASRPVTPSPLSSSISLKDLGRSPKPDGDDARGIRTELSQDMPPPFAPSQTILAHELRETAKQTRPSDERPTRAGNEPRTQGPSPSSPPSRRRSLSPPSRPGRDKDRERERERDREPHRGDRHRSDKDRDRKEKGTAERGSGASTSSPAPMDDRGLPARPDTRHRGGQHDDSLGKRRRGPDDDSERATKRPSRKDSHHEDRSMRSSDKDREKDRDHDRTRESDRRKKDREPSDGEGKGLTVDTNLSNKRIPDGPASAKLPPSAPRAMASSSSTPADIGRVGGGSKGDSNRGDRSRREAPPPRSPNVPSGPAADSGGLRARIGDKEPPPNAPLGPAAQRGEPSRRQSMKDEDSDGGKKRSASDRERESSAGGATKRPKIQRDRYAVARAALRDTGLQERSAR
ncbi:THO complex subunit 2 [Steccherinum ochraceum]|uniref:THO complex subunit 2 n=1 Tax=Steccherinum ochraceum TaxID=92696 RepID=A0A4V2MWV5_9APHY|nr:THO complex subunit 2 [Steccherinum ochraceum]